MKLYAIGDGRSKKNRLLGSLRHFDVALIALVATCIIFFLRKPTIDFDEGFFFQTAAHARQTGLPGFPWTDAYFGKPTLFIPLNSLLPLFNWPLAYLPQQGWLFAGRLLSALSVLGALSILFSSRSEDRRTSINYFVAVFAATCLPLWLYARLIRPEALLLLTFCAALALARQPSNLRSFAAGALCGAAVLLHTIQGPIIGLIVAGVVITQRTNARTITKLIPWIFGVLLCLVSFYGWYLWQVGPRDFERQVMLFAGNMPRSVSSHEPWAHFCAWLSYIRNQVNVIPLLGVAIIAIVAAHKSEKPLTHRLRLFQFGIVGFMLFWIFLYPKKAFSPVVVLLPLTWYILADVHLTRKGRKIVLAGLVICLMANSALSLRYHLRLLRAEPSQSGTAKVVDVLRHSGVLEKRGGVAAKLWLVFDLPRDVNLWDVTVTPKFVPQLLGGNQSGRNLSRAADAVVLEAENGHFIDREQEEMAGYCRHSNWKEAIVPTSRYFTPIDLIIFIRPNGLTGNNEF